MRPADMPHKGRPPAKTQDRLGRQLARMDQMALGDQTDLVDTVAPEDPVTRAGPRGPHQDLWTGEQ